MPKTLLADKKNSIKKSPYDVLFDVIVHLILIVLAIVTIVPFLQVITLSLAPPDVAGKFGLHLFPTSISWDGYRRVMSYSLIWTSYLNTFFRVMLGTSLNVFLLIIGAYPLSKKYLPNLKFWTIIIIVTMYFSGGMVPSYILITKYLGLKNSFLSLILPTAVSAYNLIIVRNFFSSIPESLEESAKLDGAGDITILFKIIVPLSMPVLATVSLWCVVGHWNAWFDCLLYIDDQKKYVLQLVLRQLLLEGSVIDTSSTAVYVNNETMKMATIVVSTIPVLCIYPFLQKYFVKGVMIGAVKG